MKQRKEFSPLYLIKSAYNAAAQEVAREMVLSKYPIGKKFGGGKMNGIMNDLVANGKAVPTRERFTFWLARLCANHNVQFEGGIEAFCQGAWNLANGRN